MNKEKFNSIEKLYHYTSFDTALKILLTNSLHFGKLEQMNDVNESYRSVFYSNKSIIDSIDVENALREYQQLSFTHDTDCYNGYNIPSMWGHYGDKGYGVCLVFDKHKILSYLDKVCWCDDITYSTKYNGTINIENDDIHLFFENHKNEIFFTKTKDWEYEQEFRILKRNLTNGIDAFNYRDSLVSVIMYFARDVKKTESIFNSVNVKMIKRILPNLNILELGNLFGESNLRDSEGKDWLINKLENKELDL